MLALAWLFVIAGAAVGYGHVIAGALKVDLSDGLERATIKAGLGTGFLILATFVLGLAHLVGRASALVLIVPAAAFGFWRFAPSLSGTAAWFADQPWPRRLLLAVLVVCVAANLVGTLAPPSFIDALVYHLFIPRTYLRAGGIIELPAIWQSYQPLGVEMLFTIGFALHGAQLAALSHTALGVLAASATGLLGRRIAGSTAGLLAAAIFYCTAMISWESTSCFVELGITAFSVLGFYAILRWSDEQSPRWLMAAGFFLGLAGTCKLTAIQFAVISAALVAWISWRRGPRAIAARVATLMAVAVGLCVPWYVHSFIWTGNPFYPFATRLFGDNPVYAGVWSILSGYGPGHSIKDLLLAPWRLFSNGAAFECAQYLSPLPLVVGPAILLRLKGSRDRQVLAVAVGIAFLLWLGSAHIARYLIPLQPLLAVLAADAILSVAAGSRYLARLMAVTSAIFVGFGALSTVVALKNMLPVVVGRESVDSYLTRTSILYTAYRMTTADVPENGLILTNQGPTFYLDRPHVRVLNAEFLNGPERVARALAGARYTHILVQGSDEMEASVAALGPRVRRLWHRDIDSPLSRTFGGTIKVPAALFEIVR